ncbi:MAG: uncharacterized protein H6Q37_1198 [Chloroflexi bacterium]|nr:uncharacterized protein [Chloroflexota bacterium]
MPFKQNGAIRYYQFEIFAGLPLDQAVFTRHGGVSSTPWASLNLGGTVGDDPAHVRENRLRAFTGLALSPDSIYDVWQVHSNEVVISDRPRPTSQPHIQADAILTAQQGVTLFMRFADCVPVLLYDPRRKVIGLVHAGWMGTVNHIAARAVEAMQAAFHSNPMEILAAVGPSIGPHHYEIGPEVVMQVQQAFGQDAPAVLESSKDGKPAVKFDLWNANRLVLERAGVRQVEIAGICTACNPKDWYSHRGENGQTGRFGAVIALI